MNAHSREELARLVEDLPTKSAKIRRLDEAGLSRSEIAKFLGLRYQHVRNVLVADETKLDRQAGTPRPAHLKLDGTGRVLLPAAFRAWLGAENQDTLVISAVEGAVKLTTLRQAVEEARTLAKRHVTDGAEAVDAFIADRRQEAERE